MVTKRQKSGLAAFAFGAWLVPLCMWAAEQALSSQAWWPNLPWGTITAALLLFSFGFYMRDSYSHHPWFSSLFSGQSAGFKTTASFVDFVENETQWFVPTLHLKFWQDTDDGRIVVRVFEDTGESFVSFERKSIPHRKGDITKIPLCLIHNASAKDNAGYHSIWGESPGRPELSFSDRNVISGRKYWVRVNYHWAEKSEASDTFFLKLIPRPERAGGGICVLFGLVADFIPDQLN